ncbi:cyclin-domain-containing protein [Microdochium trichocladiopsis]|uniref:Cyclin-domain-containing protein n=1 Tax=Microdochium trichocladiopsis TaxID=1682393 RepID=A0A9P8YFE8_9PEZI|nr:cyclin-domain-containing protein [Microdochium trichocladiopsis]KAH7038328.1 cyclin-domain-containing protein [Microdochium trichocladiopsis]
MWRQRRKMVLVLLVLLQCLLEMQDAQRRQSLAAGTRGDGDASWRETCMGRCPALLKPRSPPRRRRHARPSPIAAAPTSSCRLARARLGPTIAHFPGRMILRLYACLTCAPSQSLPPACVSAVASPFHHRHSANKTAPTRILQTPWIPILVSPSIRLPHSADSVGGYSRGQAPQPVMSQEGDAQHHAEPADAHTNTVTPKTPPPKPNPSADPKLESQARTPPPLHFRTPTTLPEDLFHVTPLAALRLLSAAVEALVNVTGDIPPTPPLSSPPVPHMSGMAREKAAIVRSHSNQDLSRVAEEAKADDRTRSTGGFFDQATQPAPPIDGVHLRASPTPPPSTDSIEPYIVIGANSQPLNLQHSAITRKFYSKKPPPISVSDYLARIHHYCPMSTAVYLATSYYIFRLAVEERAIAVTGRNCHRLLLAGLRVAMKALEDLSYPHAKFSRVGGVSEVELGRLEINFCFLAGFELMVTEEVLRKHWESLKDNKPSSGGGVGGLQGPLSAIKLTHRRKITAESVAG